MQWPSLNFPSLDIRRYLLKRKLDSCVQTRPNLPAITVTDKIQSVDKTSTLCSMINMLIKNRFACITIKFGEYDYTVVHAKKEDHKILVFYMDYAGKIEDHKILVFYMDYAGKIWCTLVDEFNAFSIFRGV